MSKKGLKIHAFRETFIKEWSKRKHRSVDDQKEELRRHIPYLSALITTDLKISNRKGLKKHIFRNLDCYKAVFDLATLAIM